MQSNYKRLGDYIKEVKTKNTDLSAKSLLGINIDKFFMPSVANIIGTDMANYRIVKKGQFACNRMHVGRDYRIPIALSNKDEPFMVSPAYDVFEIIDTSVLVPEYLMMWFTRKEFDRNAWFYTDADVRGGLPWKSFCDMQLPILHPDKQREIVKEYNTIVNRIKLNEQLNKKLEETAQALYKQWFVDFEFPNENGKPYKSNGGQMEYCEELEKEIPKGWEMIKFGKYIFYQEGPGLREWQWTDEGIKVINVKNILFNGIVDTKNSLRFISNNEYKTKYPHFLVDANDIVIASSGNTYGKVGKVLNDDLPLLMNTSVIRFHSLNESLMPNSFVQIFLFSTQMKSQIETSITGSAQPNFGPSHIEKMKLLYPKPEILLKFNYIAKPLIDKKDKLNMMNKSLKKLEEILLSRLAIIHN